MRLDLRSLEPTRENPTMKHVLPLLIGTLLLSPAAEAFPMKCMPIYGNWCGSGHPRSGDFPPPVDAFDAACMRHDLCSDGPGPNGLCDVNFVHELRGLANQYGYLPRSLQWAEYVIRVKAGGNPFSGMPTPTPFDAMGAFGSLATPCW
jgi:hypothetical protein